MLSECVTWRGGKKKYKIWFENDKTSQCVIYDFLKRSVNIFFYFLDTPQTNGLSWVLSMVEMRGMSRVSL